MINNELCKLSTFNKDEAIIFISHSDGEVRAKVWNTTPQNHEQAIKKLVVISVKYMIKKIFSLDLLKLT